MEQMMNTMILGFLLVSVVILSLILIFWIQGRIHETGILLSMGIPKFQIIGQYVIEMMMLAVVSFSFAAVSGSLISRKIGKTIIQTFAFHAGLPELGTAFLLGTGMIVLSVVAASAAIIRLKPKEILSKMS